jgi:hypothetical protein
MVPSVFDDLIVGLGANDASPGEPIAFLVVGARKSTVIEEAIVWGG